MKTARGGARSKTQNSHGTRKIKIPQALVTVYTILTQNVGNKGRVENLGLAQGQAHPSARIPQGPNIDAHSKHHNHAILFIHMH